jgi:hypothetical protein
MPEEESVHVDSIVARRDQQPYIRLFRNDQQIAQLSVAQARSFANDIVQHCARAEADAMVWKFFRQHDLPEQAGNALMIEFRKFRLKLDSEQVEKQPTNPDTGEPA